MHRKRPFRHLVIGWLVVVMTVTALLVLRPQPVLSDAGLTGAVAAVYGARTEDASLHQLAHERAAFQVAFSGGVCGPDALTHLGLVTAEVLACNYLGPERAVEQWQGSITHHAILSDPSLNLIGCGSAAGTNGSTFYACTLSAGSVAQPTPAPVVPAPPAEPVPTPQPVLLPNTAIEHGGEGS